MLKGLNIPNTIKTAIWETNKYVTPKTEILDRVSNPMSYLTKTHQLQQPFSVEWDGEKYNTRFSQCENGYCFLGFSACSVIDK
jgi:hypothetical protein